MSSKYSLTLLSVLTLSTCLCAYFFPKDLFVSYLISYIFFLSVSIGALGMLFVYELTGGGWGIGISTPLQKAASGIYILAPLCLPLLVSLPVLYPWATLSAEHESSYLSVPYFAFRLFVYILIWCLLFFLFRKRIRSGKSLEGYSAVGLFLLFLTISFAAIDWVMSLTPGWTSTAFGLIFTSGFALSGFSAASLIYHYDSLTSSRENRWDHAKILLTLLILLLYLEYAQYLVIWSGNISHEAVWYVARTKTSWKYLAGGMLLAQFALPFLLLLFQGWKPNVILSATALILIARFADLSWTILPSVYPDGLYFPRTLPLAALVVGFVWIRSYMKSVGEDLPV
jgi:hypothetical protein